MGLNAFGRRMTSEPEIIATFKIMFDNSPRSIRTDYTLGRFEQSIDDFWRTLWSEAPVMLNALYIMYRRMLPEPYIFL